MAVFSNRNLQTNAAVGDRYDAIAGIAEFCNIN